MLDAREDIGEILRIFGEAVAEHIDLLQSGLAAKDAEIERLQGELADAKEAATLGFGTSRTTTAF